MGRGVYVLRESQAQDADRPLGGAGEGKGLGAEVKVIWIESVRCAEGHELRLDEFAGPGMCLDWPVPCTKDLVRRELVHPGCGGTLLLSQTAVPR